MHNHFDKFLNVKDLILKYRPVHIVECGAAYGQNTRQLLSLLDIYKFKLTVISDNIVIDESKFKYDPSIHKAEYIRGISYKEFEKMPDDSVDMCIIDTDHNYWTLMRELESLHPKLKKNGIVCMHDINTFYYDTGVSIQYEDGTPYPLKEIEETGAEKGSLGTAVIDFLHARRFDYKLLRYSEESHGGLAIQKAMVRVMTYFATNRTSEVDDILKKRGATWTEGVHA